MKSNGLSSSVTPLADVSILQRFAMCDSFRRYTRMTGSIANRTMNRAYPVRAVDLRSISAVNLRRLAPKGDAVPLFSISSRLFRRRTFGRWNSRYDRASDGHLPFDPTIFVRACGAAKVHP